MENVPAMIERAPELAPGIILGAIIGAGVSLGKDLIQGTDDAFPIQWWQAGGIGAILGSIAWMFVIASS